MCQLHPNLPSPQIVKAVNLIIALLQEGLASRSRIEIRGFGAFSVRTHLPKTTINPRTNAPVQLEEQQVVYFRASKILLEMINRD